MPDRAPKGSRTRPRERRAVRRQHVGGAKAAGLLNDRRPLEVACTAGLLLLGHRRLLVPVLPRPRSGPASARGFSRGGVDAWSVAQRRSGATCVAPRARASTFATPSWNVDLDSCSGIRDRVACPGAARPALPERANRKIKKLPAKENPRCHARCPIEPTALAVASLAGRLPPAACCCRGPTRRGRTPRPPGSSRSTTSIPANR